MDDTSTWAQHRPRVVAAAAAAVRGVDAEEAASRALVKMLRLADDGVVFEAPLAYWRRAAVNEAYSLVRESERARPVEDDVLAALAPAAPDMAALESERQADVDMLRRALDGLTGADRDLLWSRHVDERSVTAIAEGLAVRPHAVTVRLRRAEERLAAGFAAAHTALTDEADCRAARAGMHAYLKGRLSGRRRRELEEHVDGCAACTRAFVDVREVSWGLKAIAPWLGAGAALKAAAAVSGAGVAGAGVAGATRRGRTTTAVVAGGALVVAAGVASAMVLGGSDDPAAPAATVAVQAAGGVASGAGGGVAGGGAAPVASTPTTAATPSASSTAPASAAGGADTGRPGTDGAASRGDDGAPAGAVAPTSEAGPASRTSPTRATTGQGSPTAPSAVPSPSGSSPADPATAPGPTPAPAEPTAAPSTPTAPATPPPTQPVTRTVTVELPVHDLTPGLYRVKVSDGATITRVSAPHADTSVSAWVGGRWYVQVWRADSPHVVRVTLTGPAGSTAWLSQA